MEDNQIHQFLMHLDKARRRLTGDELEVLYELSAHPNPLVRSDVAALLIDHYEEKSESVLLRLTYDRNGLVRTDAVDSLCIGRKEAVLQRLVHLAEHDMEYTVRGYAVHSTYDVLINLFGDSDNAHKIGANILEPLLEKEQNRWVQTCYYGVLHLCGDTSCLQHLLDCLEDENYYVRNSVLDTFYDILDENNESDIEEALQYYLPFEEQESLLEKMDGLLQVIQEYNDELL